MEKEKKKASSGVHGKQAQKRKKKRQNKKTQEKENVAWFETPVRTQAHKSVC